MRISNWSSDVCSSVLADEIRSAQGAASDRGAADAAPPDRRRRHARAMRLDRPVPAGPPQQGDQPLRLAERVDITEERQVGKGCVSKCRSRLSAALLTQTTIHQLIPAQSNNYIQ